MDYRKIYDNAVKRGDIDVREIDAIRQGIIDSMDQIHIERNQIENDYLGEMGRAELIETELLNNGFDPAKIEYGKMRDLPAFLNAGMEDIGDKHPDEIRNDAEYEHNIGLDTMNHYMQRLFSDVWEMDHYGALGNTVIISDDIANFLGDEYNDYSKKREMNTHNDGYSPVNPEDIDKDKLFSEKYADAARDMCHIVVSDDYVETEDINKELKRTGLDFTNQELDYMAYMIRNGVYGLERHGHIGTDKSYAETTFEPGKNLAGDDVGMKLCGYAQELSEAFCDEFGLPDGSDPGLIVVPNGPESFSVAYRNFEKIKGYYDGASALQSQHAIADAVIDKLSDIGYNESDFMVRPATYVSANDYEGLKNLYGAAVGMSRDEKISKYDNDLTMQRAKQVMDRGFNSLGYNVAGFDDTGHSRGGDYNSMYDSAFTDQGPDF